MRSVTGRAEPVIQTELRGMNAAERVVEAKRSAPQWSSGRRCHGAAALEPVILAKGNEHVFALHAPISSQRPFDAAAGCPRGDGIAAGGGDQPIATASADVLARIDDRSPGRNESDAALGIEQGAVPSVA